MKKMLMMAIAVILVVVISVSGTLAYLTDTQAVVNTFTVGQVGITLTETDAIEGTDGNLTKAYEKILPGHTYAKDPTVTVDPESEDCYVYVEVINGLADIEIAADDATDAKETLTEQIAANGWTALGVGNVYYKKVLKTDEDKTLEVFADFTVKDSATNAEMAAVNEAKITITAYAIQESGFADASAAWTALTNQLNG